MSGQSDSEQLHERFAALARERMVATGWSRDEDAECVSEQSLIAALKRPAAGGFVAMACFVREHETEHNVVRVVSGRLDAEPGPLVVRAVLGMRYPPGDRLLGLLGHAARCAIGSEVGALLDPPGDSPVRVEHAAEIPAAVETLALLIEQHADRYAAEHASVDAMIAGWKARDPSAATSVAAFSAELRACSRLGVPDAGRLGVRKLPAVLLAATDRREEARAAITEALAANPDAINDADRRFARRLERFIDSGAAIPDFDIATWLRRQPAHERLGYGESRRQSQERRAALDAVRQIAPGKTGDELRALLESELARRGLEADPVWIELQLDDLEHPRSLLERIGGIGSGVATLVAVGRDVKSIFDEGRPEPPPQPAWLEPPEHAAYDVRTSSADSAVVALDEDAGDWLDQAHRAARMHTGPMVYLDVWLTWARDPPGTDAQIVVYVGERRVGTLNAAASERLRPVMEAAALVGELPRMHACLVRRRRQQHRFMLILSLPVPITTNDAGPPASPLAP